MNVIVFKKKESQDKYFSCLLENNFHPTFIPVLDHQLDNISLIKSILYNGPKKENITGLILTSQRSVQAINACITSDEPFEPHVIHEWSNLPIYIVGSQTAAALSTISLFQHNNNCIVQPKASDLINHFPTTSSTQFLLFLAGDKRRDVIPQALEKLHIPCREIQSYSTCIHPDLKSNLLQLHHQKLSIDWLVLFSPSGLQFIITAIKDHPELMAYYFSNTIRIASIGPTTTEFIHKTQINPNMPIATAEKPDPQHLLQVMIK